MNYLESNWNDIKRKVVLPLWNNRFKSMYESIKMDYDDFESLAAIELTKAIKTFNPEKSNLFTYSTNVINKKAMTELRNCTQRDVRKALYTSESFDAVDSPVVKDLVYDEFNEKDSLSDNMLKYLDRLSTLQRRVLFLISDGFDNNEIRSILEINEKDLTNALSGIKAYRNISLLF